MTEQYLCYADDMKTDMCPTHEVSIRYQENYKTVYFENDKGDTSSFEISEFKAMVKLFNKLSLNDN